MGAVGHRVGRAAALHWTASYSLSLQLSLSLSACSGSGSWHCRCRLALRMRSCGLDQIEMSSL